MKKIAILGSTGSIGTQTLDVVRQHPDLFKVQMISANSSTKLLAEQALEFDVPEVVVCREDLYPSLRDALPGRNVHCGIDAACALVQSADVDIVVAAMVGFSGLKPTLAALEAGKRVALANKETLVAAGPIVMATAHKHNADILPVDSEHSAIFQCLQAAGRNEIARIHLTASGGPFRKLPRDVIAGLGKDAALKHPNWDMGAKITIDSATMMNKGFEVIEAKWLFNVDVSRIHVVVHPESVIHSMIEFADGAVLAQLGCPDMREPIQYAMSYPERLSLNNKKLDFAALSGLSFFEPDLEKFPCLALAFAAIERGGNAPCALNAANEAAVAAYLHDKIGFYDISSIVEKVVSGVNFAANPSLHDIFETHEESYRRACEMI